MSTIGAWTPTIQTCGHCLAEFTGPFNAHTCERPAPHLTTREMKPLAGGFTSETARRHFTGERATENLANALASSPTFKVELTPALVANLAAADALSHGEHLTTTGQARKSIVSRAAREYGAMRAQQGLIAQTKRGYYRYDSKGANSHAADARYYLGLGITVQRAIALVREEDRETARQMAQDGARAALAWSAARLQARADAST